LAIIVKIEFYFASKQKYTNWCSVCVLTTANIMTSPSFSDILKQDMEVLLKAGLKVAGFDQVETETVEAGERPPPPPPVEVLAEAKAAMGSSPGKVYAYVGGEMGSSHVFKRDNPDQEVYEYHWLYDEQYETPPHNRVKTFIDGYRCVNKVACSL
jgi:hypothetical protein